jgi:PST family polysaccharide transporter
VASGTPGGPDAPPLPSRRRSLFRGGRSLAIAELTAFLVPLAVLPKMTRTLGAASYGRLQFVMTLGAFAGLLADLGLGRVATRLSARRPERVGRVLARVQPWRFAAALASAAVLVGAAFAFAGGAETRLLVAAQAAISVAQALSCDAYLLGVGDAAWVGALRSAQLLVYGAAIFALVRTPDDAVVVLSITLATSVGFAVATRVRLRRRAGPLRWRPTRATGRVLLAESLGYALSSTMSSVYARIDVLFLRVLRGEAAVGLYGAAVRLTEGVLGVGGVVMNTLYPRAVTESRTSPRRASVFAHRALRIAGALLVPAAFGAAAAGAPLLAWVSGPTFQASDVLMSLLGLVPLVGFVATVSTAFGLAIQGRTRALLGATAFGAAVNVGANVVAIPAFGTEGAAATTVLAQAVVALAGFRASRPPLHAHPVRAYAGWLLPSVAMAALVVGLRVQGVHAGLLLLAGVVAYPLVVLVTRSGGRRPATPTSTRA